MSYHWMPNIFCEIREGKVFLDSALGSKAPCSGACHSCGKFLGVDLWDTGKDRYRACCIMVESNASLLDRLLKLTG